MTKSHLPHAVVTNANHIVALSLLRSLGHHRIPIIGIIGTHGSRRPPYADIVGASRFLSAKYEFDETHYDENCLRRLLEIGETLDRKAVLFPASDQDMILVSRHRDVLCQFYHLAMPSADMLSTLLQKERFHAMAIREQLPVPRTFLPKNGDDIAAISHTIRFPCIIKPSWRDEAWVQRHGNLKVLHCESAADLEQHFHATTSNFSGLIIQEIVTGPESNLVCSFSYFDERSTPVGMLICRKLRQFPPYFGNTALAETATVPEINDLTSRIARQLGLIGYVGMEFKYDPRDSAYKIIEITPSRPNRQIGVCDTGGLNLPHLWYCHAAGLPLPTIRPSSRYGRRWASEVNSLRSARHYLRTREWTLLQWMKSFLRVRKWEIFSLSDPLPFLLLLPALFRTKLTSPR